MASPVDAGRATSGGAVGSGTTSVTVTLPASVASGDTLIIVLCQNNNQSSIPATTGWTNFLNKSSAVNQALLYDALYRIADGTEGASAAINIQTTTATIKWSAVAWRVTGGHQSTAPVASAGNTVLATTAPDPDNVSPAGGSNDYLFLWTAICGNQPTMPPTGNPTNYSNPTGVQSGGTGSAGTKCCTFGASRQATATSEDPGTWTISTSADTIAATIAIYPAPPVAPTTGVPSDPIRALAWLGA